MASTRGDLVVICDGRPTGAVPSNYRIAEYFAGIGLARLGLERASMSVVWSNDLSVKKHRMYQGHFSLSKDHTFALADLQTLSVHEMPSDLDVAWASFPCTDLSLAGARGGLSTGASSAFWFFVRNLAALGKRRPRVIALENVTGFVSSRAGRDIAAAIRALNGLGYSVDVLNIDARRFLPQSRPRLFLIGLLNPPTDDPRESDLRPDWLAPLFEDPSLATHRMALPSAPPLVNDGLTALVERLDENDPRWWDQPALERFRASLSDLQAARLESMVEVPDPMARSAFRRMRNGVPRWEIRPDDVAGCLRTARGGSSRQAVVWTAGGRVRVRWMTPLEYARLMGAGDYRIGDTTIYDAYSGFGDAVSVPVVEWIARNYIRPHLDQLSKATAAVSVPTAGLEVPRAVERELVKG